MAMHQPDPPLTPSHRAAADGPPLDDVALGVLLRRVAAAAPARTALVDGQPDPADRRRWTYAEMLAEAEAVGRALAARFTPGEHVAIWAPNRPEWVLFQYGAALAGLVLVTVNPAYRSEELRYVLRQSRAAGIIHDATYRGVSLTALVEEVRPDLDALRDVLCFDAWDELVADGRARPDQPLPAVDPATPCQIQ